MTWDQELTNFIVNNPSLTAIIAVLIFLVIEYITNTIARVLDFYHRLVD